MSAVYHVPRARSPDAAPGHAAEPTRCFHARFARRGGGMDGHDGLSWVMFWVNYGQLLPPSIKTIVESC